MIFFPIATGKLEMIRRPGARDIAVAKLLPRAGFLYRDHFRARQHFHRKPLIGSETSSVRARLALHGPWVGDRYHSFGHAPPRRGGSSASLRTHVGARQTLDVCVTVSNA